MCENNKLLKENKKRKKKGFSFSPPFLFFLSKNEFLSLTRWIKQEDFDI